MQKKMDKETLLYKFVSLSILVFYSESTTLIPLRIMPIQQL